MIPAQNTKMVNLTPPGALVDAASLTIAELDTNGYNYCQFYLITGATDIGVTAMQVEHGDATGVTAALTGTVMGTAYDIEGDISVLPSATDDNGIWRFDLDLRKVKRFIDGTITVGDGSAGGYYVVVAVLSEPDVAPITNTGCGCVQVMRV